MQKFPAAPIEIFKSTWRNKTLINALVIRDIVERYRGSYIGLLWAFINPLIMLLVYTFVFSIIFKSRWPGTGDSKVEFSLILFAGLIVFNFFSECVVKSTSIIVSNINYVKKVIFPLETLLMVNMGSAFFNLLVALVVWIMIYIICLGLPNFSLILLPVILLPFLLFTLGITLFFSSFSVYMKDFSQFSNIIVTVLMFLSPVFYPIEVVPESFRFIFQLNPLAYAVSSFRSAIFFGALPDFKYYLMHLIFSLVTVAAGFAWFQKTRKGFADVI
jgi:lipopolysaccharide transport system permease protein